MTTASNTSGRFVWHELVTPDPKAALPFYAELLGWGSREMDMGPAGTYTVLTSGGADVGGATKPPPGQSVPPSWLAYCAVSDVDAATAVAKSHGGKVMAPPMDIPTVGRFAVIVDPQGAVLAPFRQAETRPEREGNAPVGSFCWDELVTSDPAAALAFYKAIYGFTSEDRDMGPMGTYHVLKRGDRQAGGIMKSPMPSAPSSWIPYVAVADVDDRAKRVPSLRGKVIVPPADIPGIGRFSVVADAQGAVLALFHGAM